MNKPVPTSPADLKRINAMVNGLEETMAHLYSRWQDEKEYEDINDYGAVIIKKLPKGFKLLKMSKRPFGFDWTMENGFKYQLTMTARQLAWKRIG